MSLALIFLSAAPARAELVFFSTGRSLSVAGHRTEGGQLVLTLRGGGEVACPPSMIARIAPDEMPYPDPPRAEPPEADPRPSDRLKTDGRYSAMIDKLSAEQGVDPRLVRAVIQVESAYHQRARSNKGAIGLMQLMPETARQYGVADPYVPASNLRAGITHLAALLRRFPTALALAAYNAGEAAVEQFRGIPPYPETRAYVSRILSLASR